MECARLQPHPPLKNMHCPQSILSKILRMEKKKEKGEQKTSPCNLVSSWKLACKDPKFGYISFSFIPTKRKQEFPSNFIKKVKLKILEKCAELFKLGCIF